MDRIKWLWIACAIVTFVGVVLSVFSLLLIANMAKEAEEASTRSEEFFHRVDQRVEQIEETVNSISEGVTTRLESCIPDVDPDVEEDVEADVLFDSICIRERNGKIALYTSNGIHLRTLDLDVSILPEADQAALRSGITVNSWRELFALIDDLS